MTKNLHTLTPETRHRVIVDPLIPFIEDNGKLYRLDRNYAWKAITGPAAYVLKFRETRSVAAIRHYLRKGAWPTEDLRRGSKVTEELRKAVMAKDADLAGLAKQHGLSESYLRLIRANQRKLERSEAPAPAKAWECLIPGVGKLVMLTQAEAKLLTSALRALPRTADLTLVMNKLEGQNA